MSANEHMSATEMLGGVTALQKLKFPKRTQVILRRLLCTGAKPDKSGAHSVVFRFWIAAFQTVYLDHFSKIKAGYMLHAINTAIEQHKWSS